MSLLEDIFLQDEAVEAQELERIIEGDEFEGERPERYASGSDDEGPKGDDEAEEDKQLVDPKKPKSVRVVKNPRVTLNPARLTGPRGMQVIPDHFKDFHFKGKGHEKEDLDVILKKLEHWAHRLYPKFEFEDCLKKIETLGKKRPVMVHLRKIRSDQFASEDAIVQKDSSDDEQGEKEQPQEEDEFDKLLQQQLDLVRRTPGGEVNGVAGTPMGIRSPPLMPKATSSPSISDEQKERMIRNRKLAEERRLARLRLNTTGNNTDSTSIVSDSTQNKTYPNHLTGKTFKTAIEGVNYLDNRDSEMYEPDNFANNSNDKNSINDSTTKTDTSAFIDLVKAVPKNNTTNEVIEVNENGNIVNSSSDKFATKNTTNDNSVTISDEDIETKKLSKRKIMQYNASDTSDDDCELSTVLNSTVVDVHTVNHDSRNDNTDFNKEISQGKQRKSPEKGDVIRSVGSDSESDKINVHQKDTIKSMDDGDMEFEETTPIEDGMINQQKSSSSMDTGISNDIESEINLDNHAFDEVFEEEMDT